MADACQPCTTAWYPHLYTSIPLALGCQDATSPMLLKVQPGHPLLRLVASLAASLCRLGQVEFQRFRSSIQFTEEAVGSQARSRIGQHG